jgi:dolichol-phosphate mannosyltransferase
MIYTIIPAFNEARNLVKLIPALGEIYAKSGEDFILLVVNDGSRDDTTNISFSFAKRYPIEVVTHDVNRGVGWAFRTGIQKVCKSAAAEDVVIIIEADGTCDPVLIPRMVTLVREGFDVVIASRYQPGGGYTGFPLARLVYSYSANCLFRILFPIPETRDYTIFYRGYRTEILRRALDRYGDRFIECRTFAANAEILVKLRRLGIRVAEIPMVYAYDLKQGKSNLPVKATILEYAFFIGRAFMGKTG